MKFIEDTQLPFKLAVFIRKKGYDCIHTTDTSKGHLLQDDEIVKIAVDAERTVISKDSDFLDNFKLNGAPPKILYLTFGNIANKALLQYFGEHFDSIIALFDEGFEFVEFNQAGLFVAE